MLASRLCAECQTGCHFFEWAGDPGDIPCAITTLRAVRQWPTRVCGQRAFGWITLLHFILGASADLSGLRALYKYR